MIIIANIGVDKSFADDLVSSRYCKCESNLCITIHWGFCGVSSICSSLISIIICRMPWQSLELSVWADFERMSNGFWADFTRISKVIKSVRKSARNPSGISPNPPESVRNPPESVRNPPGIRQWLLVGFVPVAKTFEAVGHRSSSFVGARLPGC